MSDALFLPDGDGFFPQTHATGPWSADFLHGGPPCALVTRGFERGLPDDFQLARVTFELLRPVGFARVMLKIEIDPDGVNMKRGTAVLEADERKEEQPGKIGRRKEGPSGTTASVARERGRRRS